jgi:hypothetical protein
MKIIQLKARGKGAGEKDKGNLQQEIASIVKLALKVPYKKKKITKEEYKNIMKQVVSKVKINLYTHDRNQQIRM